MSDKPVSISESTGMAGLQTAAYIARLETENMRLRKVVDAARVAADMTVIPEGQRTFGAVAVKVMEIRAVLRDALAKLEGEPPTG